MSKLYTSDAEPLQFFHQRDFKQERAVIDNYTHDIIKSYGMRVGYVTQRKNYPLFPTINVPQNDLFFHAYGDIVKPNYNPPFETGAYIKFSNDIFQFNNFGLSNTFICTMHFNKRDFAFDSAFLLGDNFTVSGTVRGIYPVPMGSDQGIHLAINDKDVSFEFDFPYIDAKGIVKISNPDIENFRVKINRFINEELYGTFERRYSAAKLFLNNEIRVKYSKALPGSDDSSLDSSSGSDSSFGGGSSSSDQEYIDIECTYSFIIKNPFKAYNEFCWRLTPSVGDIVLVNTVENRVEKLEITEVFAENKAADGINPLLGEYTWNCIAVPYIPETDVEPGEITSPTPIDAHKQTLIEMANQAASNMGANTSNYKEIGSGPLGALTEDDIYGGYDLAMPPQTLSTSLTIIPTKDIPTENNYRPNIWKTLDPLQSLEWEIDNVLFSSTLDDLYFKLKNTFDEVITDRICEKYKLVKLDYRQIDSKLPEKIVELNAGVYPFGEFGFALPDARLQVLVNHPEVLDQFLEDNASTLFALNKRVVNKSIKSILFISKEFFDIVGNAVILDREISRKVKLPGSGLIVDLYDIEQKNLGSDTYKELVKETHPEGWKPIGSLKPIKKVVGSLVSIYEFGDDANSRLATNGKSLFFETWNLNGQLLRTEIINLRPPMDWSTEIADGQYHGQSISQEYVGWNWLDGDSTGIYFNTMTGERIQIFSQENDIDEDAGASDSSSSGSDSSDYSSPDNQLTSGKLPNRKVIVNTTSTINPKSDIASSPNGLIVSFNSSPYCIRIKDADDVNDVSNPRFGTSIIYGSTILQP